MRRFIAYILASITIFLGVGIAFKPVATSINADLDFRDGREITFRLSDREESEEKIDDEGEAVKYYANVMEQRLVNYGVDNYNIVTSGKDTIKVTLTTSSKEECDNVSQLLSVNSDIEVCNLYKTENDDDPGQPIPLADGEGYSWHDSQAYLTYNGASTVLVMPIPAALRDKAEEMIAEAKKYEGGDDPDPSNDDPEPAKQSIILWMGRVAGEEYEYKDDNPNIAKKIIYDQFNSTNFYYGEDKTAFQITFNPTDSDVKSISDAYNKARLMMNLLNASETLYDCSAIQTVIVPASVENLLIYTNQVNLAASVTLISTIVGFVVISLILALFYRLGAVASVSMMAANTFVTFLMFTLFRPVFNISAMVALIVVAMCSLVSSIAHNSYLKEELYKGRGLKKANYEASKKTTMITVDVTILMAITGIILYFLGGASISSAGVILVIGAVLNILLNTFILKGMMWLVTNNTNFQDKKHLALFNVNNKKVPDLSKEEKPTYFGPFVNKDYTKKKKISGIVIGTLLLAGVVGLITFGATGKIFNTSNYYSTTNEVSFAIHADNESQDHPSVGDVKDAVKKIAYKDRPISVGDVTFYTYQVVNDKENGSVDEPEIYYLQTYEVAINETDILGENFSFEDDVTDAPLSDAVNAAVNSLGYSVVESETRVSTNTVYNVPNSVGVVTLSTFVSLAVFSVYLLLRRFRASRVLSVFITSSVGATLTLGFISLTRVVATPVLSVAMVLTMLLTTLMSLFILHKDKELIKEERLRDLATRKVVLTKANAIALLPTLIFMLISVYAAINFFGLGHKEFLALFFSSLFGMLSSVALFITWFTPMCNFFDEQFSRVKLPKIRLRKKNKVKVKSNTPEEAIFIGIND